MDTPCTRCLHVANGDMGREGGCHAPPYLAARPLTLEAPAFFVHQQRSSLLASGLFFCLLTTHQPWPTTSLAMESALSLCATCPSTPGMLSSKSISRKLALFAHASWSKSLLPRIFSLKRTSLPRKSLQRAYPKDMALCNCTSKPCLVFSSPFSFSASPEDAQEALATLSNKHFQGRKLKLEFAIKKKALKDKDNNELAKPLEKERLLRKRKREQANLPQVATLESNANKEDTLKKTKFTDKKNPSK